ncbi:MAG: hypothetical protein WDN26_13940 [Chitinophagaceae bacterium]
MQVKKILVAGLLAVITFISCSKKSDDKLTPPEVSIDGEWAGKSSVLSGPYNSYYSFKIKPGGTMELLDANKQKTGEGTWEIEQGNIFSATYSFLPPASGTFSVIATFDKIKGELDGTWGSGQQIYGGGYWYMSKTK